MAQSVQEPLSDQTPVRNPPVADTAWLRMRRLLPGTAGDWVLIVVLALAGLAVDLIRLSGTSLYFDETMSAGLALQPWSVVWRYLWGPEDHMIFYYVVLHLWIQLTSTLGLAPTELLLRLPSVVFSIGGTVVIYWLARRFWGRWAGLVAAGLYLLDPLQLFHAQKARSYPLQVFLLCLAWFALYAILSGAARQRRWWVIFGVCSILAVYSQPFSALVLAAQIATFALYLYVRGPWRAHARRALRGAIFTLGAVALVCIPEGINVVLHGQSNEWVPPATPREALDALMYFAGHDPFFMGALTLAALLGVGAVLYQRWLARREARGQVLAGAPARLQQALARWLERVPVGTLGIVCWLCVPLALSFVATQGWLNLHLFWWRYLIAVLPAACLLAGIGVATVRIPVARLAVALVLLLVAASDTQAYYANAQLTDWRTPTQWVEQHYQSGDGMVCISGLLCSIPMQYYLQLDHGSAQMGADAPGNWQWSELRGVPYDPDSIARYAAQHQRIFLITAMYGATRADLAESEQEQAWLGQHYQLVGQIDAEAVSVRLYAAPAAS